MHGNFIFYLSENENGGKQLLSIRASDGDLTYPNSLVAFNISGHQGAFFFQVCTCNTDGKVYSIIFALELL